MGDPVGTLRCARGLLAEGASVLGADTVRRWAREAGYARVEVPIANDFWRFYGWTPDMSTVTWLEDVGHPSGLYNSAVLLRPPGRFDEILADVEAFFDGHGTGDVELWIPDQPDLRGPRWQLEGHPPLLLRPAGLPLPGRLPTPGLRIIPVTDVTGSGTRSRVAAYGFPFPRSSRY